MRVPCRRRISQYSRKFLAEWRRVVSATIAILIFGAVQTGAVFAQPAPQGIIGVGNGVFTGFSGVVPPPAPLPPGVLPADRTYIDLAGPSARVVDLQNMGGPPVAQLVNAPKPFTATAAQIGQTYAVALDNVMPPNIYVAATSSYGLPIVVPDKDGDGRPDRVKQGTPGASFMPGLWGPSALGGGPGSIWRIDGVTGTVTLFANVLLGGVPNSGPALGGLVFDPASNQLFVADRNTGMIHRFTLDGVERGVYDHGVTGRTAVGLPPVAFNPANRLNIANPAFRVDNPATWQLAPKERLIFGLGVRAARLFYAVADGLWIFSVSINPDGSLGTDARFEINVPPALAPTEIAKIIFDDQGRMILGERGVPVGLYDFTVLAQESVSRVLRYARVSPGPGLPPVWQPVPDEYAIGFPAQYRNANGGVAIGYRYDAAGRIDRYSCGGFLWSTGEQLRRSSDPAIAAQLAGGGPAEVNGLQGNEIELVRPANVPPFQTYFIDYDDKFGDPTLLGHMGDVAILRICGQGFLPGVGWFSPPGWIPPWGPPGYCPPWLITPGGLCGPPPLWCPPDQQKPGFQCCPENTQRDAAGICRPICPNGANDPVSLFACKLGYDPTTLGGAPGDRRCIGGSLPNPAAPHPFLACIPHSPLVNPASCPAGYTLENEVLATGENVQVCKPTPAQLACEAVGPGWSVGLDGSCQQLCPGGGTPYPTTQCCPPGAVVNAAGQCCPYGSYVDPKTGQCTPPWGCPPGWIPNPIAGGCCPPGSVIDPKTGACTPGGCPPEKWNPTSGRCCPAGTIPNIFTGECCPEGSTVDPLTGRCEPPRDRCPPGTFQKPAPWIGCCPVGAVINPFDGDCCRPGSIINPFTRKCCPAGSKIDPVTGLCVPPRECPPFTVPNPYNPDAPCCPPEAPIPNPFTGGCCPAGSIFVDGQCRPPGGGCPPGSVPLPGGGCCPPGSTIVDGQCRPVTELCRPGTTPVPPTGFCCPNGQLSTEKNRCCPAGTTPAANNQCNPITPPCDPAQMTSTGVCCPEGQQPGGTNNAECVRPPAPTPRCPAPQILNRTTGECVSPSGTPPPPPPTCPPGSFHNPNTSACAQTPPPPPPPLPTCPAGSFHSPNTSACVQLPTCPPGTAHNRLTSGCVQLPTCPQGQRHNPQTSACAPITVTCPQGQRHNPQTSACAPITVTCPQGQRHNPQTSACAPVTVTCPQGQRHNPQTSACAPITVTCPQGQRHNAQTSACATIPTVCPQGQQHNRQTSQCGPTTSVPLGCPTGQVRVGTTCVPLTKAPGTTVIPCPQGTTRNAQGQCVQPPPRTFQPLVKPPQQIPR